MKVTIPLFFSGLTLAIAIELTGAQENSMTFFLTGSGPGNGADLGGLAGADAHCAALAEAAGCFTASRPTSHCTFQVDEMTLHDA